jgi:hypothetical protein
MKIGIRLFVSSAVFGAAIATVYWFSSHDPTGTILLGVMASGLTFAAGYSYFAERHAQLIGDRASAAPGDERGVRIGVFTVRSPWPVIVAAGAFLLLTGLAVSSTAAVAGLLIIAYALFRLIAESR